MKGLEILVSNLRECLKNSIQDFYYKDISECKDVEEEYKLKLIKDLECKHYIVLNDKSQLIHNLGISAWCPNILWGYYRNATVETETEFINQMIKDKFMRPSRIVIDKYGRWWGDNTHTLISHIWRGKRYLHEIPIYIIDVRNDIPVIIDINNTVIRVDEDMKMAIASGLRVNHHIEKGWRPENISWTVKDLIENMDSN